LQGLEAGEKAWNVQSPSEEQLIDVVNVHDVEPINV
jgi:hypothetical protein